MKSVNFIFILAVFFATIGGVSSDLYLPSLPAIAHSLHTSVSLTQLSVALFMLGLSFARLIVAIVSDAFGRKNPLMISLLICLVGCACCLFATNIYVLLVGRLLQGFGAGGSNILGRVILRDGVPSNLLAKYMSYFSMIGITLMSAAPFIGGYIERYFNWRVSFVILLIYTVTALIVSIFLLPETNKFKNTDNLKLSFLKTNLKTLFVEPTFIISALFLAIGYGSLVAWLTAGPIILQKVLLLSPVTFGWCAALIGFCYFLAAFTNSKLVNRFAIHKIQRFGIWCFFAGGIMLLIPSLFFHYISLAAFILPLMLAIYGLGLLVPNSYVVGLIPFAKIAGIAAAVLSFIQVIGAFITSTIISLSPNRNQMPVGLILCVGGFICLILIRFLKKTRLKLKSV
ncbi:MAG: multidrug effflux MFS transporter [Gammaproteobacteria bacterium]|jgi:DHA1 family bicyclomycin/chloramphenicol resistance-like MFS transporter/DHA1 family 2-module integral membrane pump EmrD-like MFS transporter